MNAGKFCFRRNHNSPVSQNGSRFVRNTKSRHNFSYIHHCSISFCCYGSTRHNLDYQNTVYPDMKSRTVHYNSPVFFRDASRMCGRLEIFCRRLNPNTNSYGMPCHSISTICPCNVNSVDKCGLKEIINMSLGLHQNITLQVYYLQMR